MASHEEIPPLDRASGADLETDSPPQLSEGVPPAGGARTKGTPPGRAEKKIGLLPASELKRRMRSASVTVEGIEWVLRCFDAPARNVRGGYGNVRSEYFSPKMGFSIQSESHHIERVVLLGHEWDPDVVAYADQPHPVDTVYVREGRARPGRPRILDTVHVLDTGECWAMECKSRDELDRLLVEKPHLYEKTPDGVVQYLPVVEALADMGIRHRVVTPEDVGAGWIRNLEFLSAYRTTRVSPADEALIRAAVAARPRTIVEVAARADVPVDLVLAGICRGIVHADLRHFPLAETEHTLVHGDLRSLPAYRELAGHEPIVLRQRPDIVAGARLRWDGSPFTVVHRGARRTVLRPGGAGDDGETVTLGNADFDRFVEDGSISVETPDLAEDLGDSIGNLLMQYSGPDGDARGAEILERVECMQHLESGELSVEEAAARLGIGNRTVYNYLAAYRGAGDQPGDKLRSQILYARKPVEKPRTAAQKRMDRVIKKFYFRRKQGTKSQPTVRTAHRRYARRERKVGHRPFSRTTFDKRVRELKSLERVRDRDGPRAGNAVRPSTGLPPGRLGDWPFHRVQFDGTGMDDVVKWYEEVVGGKPWPDRPRMLIAVDGYSRAVLAWCICFLNESGEMALLVVRDLVRRHHRVPDESLFDNGSGFISGALRRLLVGVCRRTVSFRPPHDPKFSGQVERVFKEVNDGLLRNMAGYTGRLRAHRKVTKEFDPRRDAVWGLDGLARLCSAFFAIYNDTVHTEIGMTPNQALDQGWKLRGLRADQQLVYDEQFRKATLPSTSKAYVLDPKAGFYFRGNRYRNPAVSGLFEGQPKSQREFHLKFDPEDAAVVYARIRREQHAFRCDAAARLDAFQVPGDRRLVSLAMPVVKRDARREARLGNDLLTELADAIDEAQEHLSRTRRENLAKHAPDGRGHRLVNDEAAGGMEPEDGEPDHILTYLDKPDADEGEAGDAG